LFIDFFAASVGMFISVSISSGTTIYVGYYNNPIDSISLYCKIWYYLLATVGIMFRWILAAACVDRYALSSTNVRLRGFANVYIARRVVFALMIIWIILNIPLLILYDSKSSSCIIIYGYIATLYNAIYIIINSSGIPVSIMIIFTLLIRRNLANKREHRQQFDFVHQQRTNNRKQLQRKRDQQALVMLFAQIIVYIILVTPWTICSVYNVISFNVPNKSSDRLIFERFLTYLAELVVLLFPATSFYLYTLTSSMFRKELLMMLRSVLCWKWCLNNHRIEPRRNIVLQGVPAIP
jgi:hypothetical protein